MLRLARTRAGIKLPLRGPGLAWNVRLLLRIWRGRFRVEPVRIGEGSCALEECVGVRLDMVAVFRTGSFPQTLATSGVQC